jgi:hypothetical protein
MTTLLRTDLDDFLFAPVADDANGMPLTMLTALARSGVDPWLEAADLAALSREAATQKLISLLAGVPNGPSQGTDAATAASRLVKLLHPPAKPRAPAAGAAVRAAEVATQPRRARLAIYYLVALILMFVAQWALTNRDAPPPADTSVPASQ